jgi:hypothetical protein
MKLNDIVYLKASTEKLMITWVVGVTESAGLPIDVNRGLMMRPDYQTGDIAVKYGKNKKATIPGNSLIANLANRIPAINSELKVGNVVKHRLTDDEMTINWIVGQDQLGNSPINFNKVCHMQGYKDGDIVCGYFENKDYKTNFFKVDEVEKIYE